MCVWVSWPGYVRVSVRACVCACPLVCVRLGITSFGGALRRSCAVDFEGQEGLAKVEQHGELSRPLIVGPLIVLYRHGRFPMDLPTVRDHMCVYVCVCVCVCVCVSV